MNPKAEAPSASGLSPSAFEPPTPEVVAPGWGGVGRRLLWVVLPLALVFLLARRFLPVPPADLTTLLPLHSFLVMLAVVTAVLIFAVGFTTGPLRNLMVIGCAFLGAGLLDFGHLLSFPGMPPFFGPAGPVKAANFALAAGLLEATVLVYAGLSPWGNPPPRRRYRCFALPTALAYAALAYWLILWHPSLLPAAFVSVAGRNVASSRIEILFIALHLVAAAAFLYRLRKPQRFDAASLAVAALVLAAGDLWFELHSLEYDRVNLLGHGFKVIAYAFVGKAVFVDSLRAPIQRLLRSQQALLEMNQLNAALFDENSLAIHVFAADGTSLRCNRAHERLWQLPASELNGVFNLRRDPQLNQAIGRERLEQLFSGELNQIILSEVSLAPVRSGLQQGRPRWITAALFPIKAADGRVHQVVSMMADITESRRHRLALRRERDFIAAVLETAGAMVVVLDPEGRIERFNRAAERITGYRFREVRKRRMWEAFPSAAGSPGIESAVARLVAGQAHDSFEGRCRSKDGAEHLIAWTNTALAGEGGKVEFVICTGIDVTETRKAEQEARQHLAELARVGRIAIVGEMGSAMAHELNQPLAAVVNYTRGCLQRMQASAAVEPALVRAMGQAAAQAERAAEIIEQIRRFIRQGHGNLVNVDVNQLVREMAALAQSEVHQHQVQLELLLADGVPLVRANRIQVEQVILQLIRNAIEAMDGLPAGQRQVLVSTGAAADGGPRVEVRDHGPGLPEGAQERLFTPFFTTKPDGVGLGLSLSYSIIEAHGGQLRARNHPDGGALFWFSLPALPGGG